MLTKREFTKNLRKDVKETIDDLNGVVDFLNQVDTALGYPFKDEISDENLNKMMNIIGMLKKSVQDTYNKLDSIAVGYLDYKSGLKESRHPRGRMIRESENIEEVKRACASCVYDLDDGNLISREEVTDRLLNVGFKFVEGTETYDYFEHPVHLYAEAHYDDNDKLEYFDWSDDF